MLDSVIPNLGSKSLKSSIDISKQSIAEITSIFWRIASRKASQTFKNTQCLILIFSNNIHEDKLPQQKELSHFMLFTAPPAITSRVSLYHLRLSFLPQFHPSSHVYVRKTFLRINYLANGRVFSYSLLKILIPRFCQKVFCNDEYP